MNVALCFLTNKKLQYLLLKRYYFTPIMRSLRKQIMHYEVDTQLLNY